MNHTKEVPSGSILRNRNFLLIWNVGTLSTIGEMAEMLVMGWLVLQITGSPMQVAIVGEILSDLILTGSWSTQQLKDALPGLVSVTKNPRTERNDHG